MNPADFTILGHDAGNGVGNPVTLDAENDGNFTGVIASSTGLIQGTMSVRQGEGYAAVSGLQLMPAATAVPEPSTFALGLLGVLGFGVFAWRRRRIA
ncbi:MAG: PEP-CTERM sorting domain-containing protein [Planctomycetes bacterium]|nr:PEP-CTERM sorting domain-containing protein [Planctomycetota bacterium]